MSEWLERNATDDAERSDYMPCDSNAELPPGVRSSLNEEDQSKWREVYNSALEQYGNQETAARVAWAAVKKSSDSMRWFDGWVSVEKVDSQGDKLCAAETYKAVNKAIERGGVIIEEHTNRPVGAIFDCVVGRHPKGDNGVYGQHVIFQGEPLYDKVWESVRDRTYKGLSIAGYPYHGQEKKVCDSDKCWNEVGKMHIFEISVCRNPANHDSLITEVNEKAKTEKEQVMGDDKADEKKQDELPDEDKPQASVIQEMLMKIFAMLSDHVKESKMPIMEEEEAPPEEKKPEEKVPEAGGETAEEPKEEKKMEKSEPTKEEPKPEPKVEKVEQPTAPPQAPPQAPPIQPQAPPTQPISNPSPAFVPQPSTVVETPRPGVVETGGPSNDIRDLWNDASKLKRMSVKDIEKLCRSR